MGSGWIAHIALKRIRLSLGPSPSGGSACYTAGRRSPWVSPPAQRSSLWSLCCSRWAPIANPHRAKVAAPIAGFVVRGPLLLSAFGQDYFLSRNVIPAVVPVAALRGRRVHRSTRAGARRGRVGADPVRLGDAPGPDEPLSPTSGWRGVARALGPAKMPRAIFSANGLTADPLKIYLPHASWVQPQPQKVRVDEIDVVGATKRLALAVDRTPAATAMTLASRDAGKPRAGVGLAARSAAACALSRGQLGRCPLRPSPIRSGSASSS